MPSFHRTLVDIAPLCNADLTITFIKHDIKTYYQAGATVLEGWCDPNGANDWHFPLTDDDHNSNKDSLFPSDDEILGVIVSNNEPCPFPPHPTPPTSHAGP
jgi:hypothetical protein